MYSSLSIEKPFQGFLKLLQTSTLRFFLFNLQSFKPFKVFSNWNPQKTSIIHLPAKFIHFSTRHLHCIYKYPHVNFHEIGKRGCELWWEKEKKTRGLKKKTLHIFLSSLTQIASEWEGERKEARARSFYNVTFWFTVKPCVKRSFFLFSGFWGKRANGKKRKCRPTKRRWWKKNEGKKTLENTFFQALVLSSPRLYSIHGFLLLPFTMPARCFASINGFFLRGLVNVKRSSLCFLEKLVNFDNSRETCEVWQFWRNL